jgi:hypothetical protein
VSKAWVGLSIVVLAFACPGCSDVGFVDRIVIDNPTDFTANVDVTSGARDGWIGLTTVAGGSQATVQEVIDQGSAWIFRFSYAHHDEELRVSRVELVRSDWRVEVPESFAAALRARGVVPPP